MPTHNDLARLLDSPLLARIVPSLAPETLHQVIRYRGLDACAELVSAASPAQLVSLLDLDLWHHEQPGCDDQFDADRFGEWIEALVEAGEPLAARTVAALDEHLVIAGLSRYLRVFDRGTFEPTAASDDEQVDRHSLMNSGTSAGILECEVGGYLIRSRRDDAWDAIVALLVTLDADHNRCFHAVMRGCRAMSSSMPEIDGLDDLLPAPEQHLHDAALERERRLSGRGYATAADARAFLEMARHTASNVMNPIAAAYFRAAEGEADSTTERESPGVSGASASLDGVIGVLVEAGMTQGSPRGLLGAADEDARVTKVPLLRRLMAVVLNRDETAYLARSRELAFLTNTLLAGCSIQSRAFTPGEASEAAASICNLGLESWSAASGFDGLLLDRDLVSAFEAGWSILYRNVSLFAADRLIETLADLHCVDAEIERDLHALRRSLVAQREAGRPWLARDAAEVLATLDMPAWIGVLGLLDECPILPATLTAIVERQTESVSPTAFEFFSTKAQFGTIRVFMRALPGLLAG
jgi:hypothetical protein